MYTPITYVYNPNHGKRRRRRLRREFTFRDEDEICTTDIVLGLSGVAFFGFCVFIYLLTGGIC